MKLRNTLLLSAATLMVAGTTYAQTDKEELEHAHNSIYVVKSCDDALRFLSKVSAEGKTTAAYFINMANAQDCKANNEQALYYYNKYLELQPKNDSVRKRVAELSDSKSQQSRAANEERVAREVYGNAAQTKKSKKNRNILGNYFCMGITYATATGGDKKPYTTGTGFHFGLGYPIVDKLLVLDFGINTDFVYGMNIDWWKRAYLETQDKVQGAGFGFSEDLEFSPMATIVNKKNFAWTAGPMVGLKYVYTANPYIYDNDAIKGGSVFGACYGAKTSILVKDHGLFFVEYSAMPDSKYTTTKNPTGINANHSMLRLGITLRLDRY